MAMLPSAFNSDEHETLGDYSPVPAGDYNIQAKETELVLTKKAIAANDPLVGQRLKIKWEVMDGEHKGRIIWGGLNLVNKESPKAVEISQKELATICKAIGLVTIADSNELHDKPLKAKVVVKDAQGGYDASNEIKMYYPYEGVMPESPKPAGVAGAAAPEKKAGGKVW